MKSFKDFTSNAPDKPLFEQHEIEHLTEAEVKQLEGIYYALQEHVDEKGIDNIEESFLGSLLGGAAGFFAGPAVGRVIANALGIEKGIVYDMLTSRLVGTALGAAIAKTVI
jgi:hypothetical protein